MDRCFILREDPDLASWLSDAERAQATDRCVAVAISVARGSWNPATAQLSRAGIGLLVLDGLLIRRVGIDGRWGAELLGEGDLLRPWQVQEPVVALPHATGWHVLVPARMAVLDERAAERLAQYPSLMGAIAERTLNRARRLAIMMAIVHHPRIDVRIHMLLWQLADRWGRVRPDGLLVPLRLSHSVLADLVAAQRPSVTSALRKLSERGVALAVRDGWLLNGDPPGELLELREAEALHPSETLPPPDATDGADAESLNPSGASA